MIHHTPRRSLRFQPGAGSQPEGTPRCLAITSPPNTDSLDTGVQDNSTTTTFTISSSAITSTAVDILPSNTYLPATIDTISSITYTTAAHDIPLTTTTPVLLPDTSPITYMPLVTGMTSSDMSPAPPDMPLATGASDNMYTRSITTDYSPFMCTSANTCVPPPYSHASAVPPAPTSVAYKPAAPSIMALYGYSPATSAPFNTHAPIVATNMSASTNFPPCDSHTPAVPPGPPSTMYMTVPFSGAMSFGQGPAATFVPSNTHAPMEAPVMSCSCIPAVPPGPSRYVYMPAIKPYPPSSIPAPTAVPAAPPIT
ncbi:PREDICTED: leucine-rich repeat extensin-like protein 5, partial [Rhagoletis zephyria]|uniref:leucine-rich repeat extensin-like protein 5 n=1 Tax=Rhagoletis zephyria TaxID=28612 RepID=UPI000811886D